MMTYQTPNPDVLLILYATIKLYVTDYYKRIGYEERCLAVQRALLENTSHSSPLAF